MFLVTKNLAELCTLVIDDIYGELPSRIFAAFLNRGRASLPQLAQYTSLTPRQLRHGLAVLLQYDLLYYYVASPDSLTVYDANPQAAYNLLRVGKVLEMVERLHGADARDVVQSLVALGHTSVADLKEAYKAKIAKWETSAAAHKRGMPNGDSADRNGHGHGHGPGHTTNGHSGAVGVEGDGAADAGAHADTRPAVRSLEHLNSVLCRLVTAEVLEVVNATSFKTFADRQNEVRQHVMATYFPDGLRGLKKKEEFETRVSEQLHALRDEPRKLKRTLQANNGGGQLLDGDVGNGWHDTESRDPLLDPKTVLRVNHNKCAVELRNQRLVEAVATSIGETTAQVYAALLRQLTETIPRCRADPRIDVPGCEFMRPRFVTTDDLFDHLDSAVDVFTGIGKAAAHDIDRPTAERLERHAKVDVFVAGGDGSGGEEDDMDTDEADYDSEGDEGPLPPPPPPPPPLQPPPSSRLPPTTNGNGIPHTNGDSAGASAAPTTGHVTFAEPVAGSASQATTTTAAAAGVNSYEARRQQMRQHLLLLCDHPLGFLRHSDRGTWTVDFVPLLRRLRTAELDTAIERKVGGPGLRLSRILRAKGKLDEKTLPALALMKKGDVQNTMLQMQMHGFVDMQEVPRDANRSASRTLFLWFCDPARALDTLLDNTYKALVRCLRVRDVHRRANEAVLAFVERPDVKGREREALEQKYFDKYQTYCAVEAKLFGQVMRLDSLVATLRDY
ncbi:DNA directed RNA polymerase 3 subunit [Niveomyces insectorum RCEF 264]|uniref:DNA-directed RNA polymerase III subunit RPC3 n=1 Tax=Niveomyces insectorum RCEF 264 TaxID=1081102 RepID=A0A167ZT55_9HYPO|nr:DNA directed RNA polymerase 3 subunit [Niveomyces insectorum RCEF 264]